MRAYFLCLLLALLSSTVHSDEVSDAYAKFQNQHVFPKMSPTSCTNVIKNRNIYTVKGECKPKNTFIRAKQKDINNICKRAGEPYGADLTKSLQPFDILVCVLKDPKNTRKPCVYNEKVKPKTVNIVIACKKGWPVHLEGDIFVPRSS